MASGHLRAGPCCLLQPPPRTSSLPSSFSKKAPELEPTLPLVLDLELTLPQYRNCRPQNPFQTREREEGRGKKKKKGYASLPTPPKQSEVGERSGVKSQIHPLWLGNPPTRPAPATLTLWRVQLTQNINLVMLDGRRAPCLLGKV